MIGGVWVLVFVQALALFLLADSLPVRIACFFLILWAPVRILAWVKSARLGGA